MVGRLRPSILQLVAVVRHFGLRHALIISSHVEGCPHRLHQRSAYPTVAMAVMAAATQLNHAPTPVHLAVWTMLFSSSLSQPVGVKLASTVPSGPTAPSR